MNHRRRLRQFNKTALRLGLDVPWKLDAWQKFFINEERCLEAAEKWLEQIIKGVKSPIIEDDVQKGMMKTRPGIIPKKMWTNPMVPSWTQPQEPAIPEPNELSAVEEHCV